MISETVVNEAGVNENEQQINEASIIPANFSWRAGIGQNIPSANPQLMGHGFTPFGSSFHPGHGWDPKSAATPAEMQKNKTNVQFAQSLLGEIDTNLTGICEKYKDADPDVNTYNKAKSEMRQWFMGAYKKYKEYIGADFMEILYNTCLQSYLNQWVMICGNVGVQDISGTEYVFSNRGIEVNPFVAYQLMDSVTKQYSVNEGETITMINEEEQNEDKNIITE